MTSPEKAVNGDHQDREYQEEPSAWTGQGQRKGVSVKHG